MLDAGGGIYRCNSRFILIRVRPQNCCYFTVQMKKWWFREIKSLGQHMCGVVGSDRGGVKAVVLALAKRCP